jgi:hypothetical protein
MRSKIINTLLVLIIISCNRNNDSTSLVNKSADTTLPQVVDSAAVKGKIVDSVKSSYYSHSNAYKYLDFSNDSALFNSFLNRIDEISPPFSLPLTPAIENDSLVFIRTNYGENFTNRTISIVPKNKNELTPLFKFFRKIYAYKNPSFSIFDVSFTDSSVSVLNKIRLSSSNPQSFHLILLIVHHVYGSGIGYLCTFSKSGKFIDCIGCNVVEDGYNGYYDKFDFDVSGKIHEKTCDYYPTEKDNEEVEVCTYLTYKIRNDGHFLLIRKKEKKRVQQFQGLSPDRPFLRIYRGNEKGSQSRLCLFHKTYQLWSVGGQTLVE